MHDARRVGAPTDEGEVPLVSIVMPTGRERINVAATLCDVGDGPVRRGRKRGRIELANELFVEAAA